MIVSGMLISYIADYLLNNLNHAIAWRLMLGFAAIPAVVLFIGVLKLPESPRFLIQVGKLEEAKFVLSCIREDESGIEEEVNEIAEISKQEKESSKVNWATLFSPRYRKLVIAGIGVAAFQQFQGANAIFYYIPNIIQKATGKAATDALFYPVINGVILVAGSLLFLAIADKFNRRTMMTLGGTCMGLSFILPAVIDMVGVHNPWISIVSLFVYAAFYSFTWAPLTWVICGEIFPLAVRGKATGLASTFNWIGSFAIGLSFPPMAAALPQVAVFMIYGVICLLGVVFIRNFVVETRGRSLEQIEEENCPAVNVNGTEAA
jgi:sugar porter (SP) family MFS transporter